MNLSGRIKSSLIPELLALVRLVRTEAEKLGLPLFIVGGSVRDLVLGRVVNDFDLTVEGDAIALARALAKKHGGPLTVHSKFGTAKWYLPDKLKPETSAHDTLDIVSARSEIYKHPAALPTVKLGGIEDDIRRRDFTINALAIRLDGSHFGELRDDLNGMDDLQHGIIRILHPRSFLDDPTRMYRAVRYEKRYQFKIEEDTLALIPNARSLIEKLSSQRIRRELDLILEESNAASMLRRLDELDLLEPIHPALSDLNQSNLAALNRDSLPAQNRHSGWLLWLMHLPEQEIESINKHLYFSASLLRSLLAASAMYADLDSFASLEPSECVKRLDAYPIAAVEAVYYVIPDKKIKGVFFNYLSEWRHVKPRTTGHDLKKRGIEPGPKYAEILHRLRAAWLDGEVKTEEEELSMLSNLIR
jgi:tRNA nucleotidyltransferase (CCA-adding enzyme)